MLRFCLAAAISAAALVAVTPARAVTFTFDNYVGSNNDFSITVGSLTATFSSASGPGTFAVGQPFGIFSYAVALGDYGSFGGDPLTITFSAPVTDSIMFSYGIIEAFATAPATLTAQSDTGQAETFTTTTFDPMSGSPEGVATFVPTGPITSLTLASQSAFGIAGVTLTPVATEVPEPLSAAVLAAGLMGMASVRAASRRGWRRLPSGSGRCG